MLIALNLIAQTDIRVRFNVFNSNNGLSKQVIKGITEDKNGFIWLLSDHQLQWFDGSSFHQVPFGNGIHQIPGSLFYEIHQGTEKDIWIFYNNGYSVYNPFTFSFEHFSFSNQIKSRKEQAFFNGTKKEAIVFNNGSYHIISSITKKPIKIIKKYTTAVGLAIGKTSRHWEFFTEDSNGVYFENIETHSKHLLPNPLKKVFYLYKRINDSMVVSFAEHYYVAYDIKHQLIVKQSAYPFGFGIKSFIKNNDLINKDDQAFLMILENEIWEFNKQSLSFTKKLVGLNGSSTLNQGYYNAIFLDSKGVLWASTTLNGLQEILLQKQPVKLFASTTKEENFIKCFFVDKPNNAIVCGTFGSGIVVYDTSGNIIKRFPLRNKAVKTGTIVSAIIPLNNTNCLIMLYDRTDYYILNRQLLSIQKAKVNYKDKYIETIKPNYYSVPISISNNEYLYYLGNTKLTIKYESDIVNFNKKASQINLNQINSYPIYTKNITQKDISDAPFIQKCLKQVGLIENSLIYIDKRQKKWILGTSNGIYEFSNKSDLLKTYTVKNGLANDYIYSGIVDNNNNIWCSHDRGISKIDTNGTIINYSKTDGLQDDEFNYSAVAKTPDGELYFGGINGLNGFYPNELNAVQDNTKLIITKISSTEQSLPEDTAFWNLNNLTFKHTDNRIKIQLSTIGTSTATAYNYQYRLVGIDKEWKNLRNTREINLALNPGTYSIEMSSGKFFNKKATPQQSLQIRILPPYYLNWWFLLICSVLVVTLIWYLAKYLTNRKYRQQIQAIQLQEQLEFERQRISRDLHDNMGAYTSALMANVDKLKHVQGETKELIRIQDNAEHILNSLRETIWVLNNKEIDISNFSDEFKNYCFNVLKNFEHISFEATEKIETNYLLKAADAINLNKILQEAFQNIIKHSKATKIFFSIETSNKIVILLKDNGIGFNRERNWIGNGIENMEWRANELNAQLIIFSKQFEGTTISITKDMLSKEY